MLQKGYIGLPKRDALTHYSGSKRENWGLIKTTRGQTPIGKRPQ